jgi:hypothetical protein
MGQMIHDQSGGVTAVESQEAAVARYREQLY